MMDVRFVTYRGIYRELKASSINLPGVDGRRGILTNHMPIIVPLKIGVVDVTDENNQVLSFAVSEGVCYFDHNFAKIIVNTVESVDEIDVDRAKLAKKIAEERLKEAIDEADIAKAKAKLLRAVNRIDASSIK